MTSPAESSFFVTSLQDCDPDVFTPVRSELQRQQNQIELIASENIVSMAVLEAQGSILTNKYAEGYPRKRYYGGCAYVDIIEKLAIDRAKQLFDCGFANVQAHSGSQANQSVMLALLKPGDTILGMDLASGGHLTHGAKPNISGKWFNAAAYGVSPEDCMIDYDEVERITREHKPKLIIAGGSAYSRVIDFARFRDIADSIDAYLHVDMAHFAGLVAGGAHPNPLPHAHVVTTTTHKTLRGPRGGMVLTNDANIAKKIDSAIFPGLQGGPLMHVIAAKAVAFGEALRPQFKVYARNTIENCKTLANSLINAGYAVVSGGTDTHLALIDLRSKGVKGSAAEQALERANITCNKNGIPFDKERFTTTSGLRVGSPAGTTRGFGKPEFALIGRLMAEILDALARNSDGDTGVEASVRSKVADLTASFPIYQGM